MEMSGKRKCGAAYPAYFVLKPDGTLSGVGIPANELKATVQKLPK